MMGSVSKIEWTDSSWSPIRARAWEIQSDGSGKERIGWHCEHVSEGCRNCYAEKINLRLGTGFDFKPGNLRGKPGYYGGGTDRPKLFLDEKMLLAPLRWKKPRMIFVCSMTDLFADFVPDEWIDRVFAVMGLSPQHTFQVLTKRAERMRRYITDPDRFDAVLDARGNVVGAWDSTISYDWPAHNVWLGVSAERQQEADERIPHLRDTPAAVRFVSFEPLLGHIEPDLRGLHWVIAGGESGPNARPMHLKWARRLRNICAEKHIPFFFKQRGQWTWVGDEEYDADQFPNHPGDWRDRDRGVVCMRSDGTLVDGYGGGDEEFFYRVGKKNAGRLLDGKEHNGMPQVPA